MRRDPTPPTPPGTPAANYLAKSAESLLAVLRAVRILTSGGFGAYLASVFLIGCSLGIFRLLAEKIQSGSDVTSSLATLIKIPQEPLRPDDRPTVGAAVVGELAIKWGLCQPDPKTSEDLDSAADLFTAIYTGNTPPSTALDQIGPPAPARPLPKLTYVGALTAIPRAVEEVEDTATANASTFRAPSQVACGAPTACPSTPRLPQAIEDARVHSLWALEALEPFLRKRLEDSAQSGVSAVRRLFFVSFEGAIRLLPREPLGTVRQHRVFNHANYMLKTLSGEFTQTPCSSKKRYVSKPYLDFLGLGLVATVCYPVPEPPGAVRGIFCADVALPRNVVHDHIRRNGIFQATIYSLREGATPGKSIDALRCASASASDACREEVSDEGELKPLIAWMHKLKRTSAAAVPSATSDANVPEVVLLWRDGVPATTYRVASLAYRNPSLDRTGWLLLTISALLFIASCGVVARAAIQHGSGRASSVTRGLQLGVIRLDVTGAIRDANERAESLLGHKLPRFGVDHGDVRKVVFPMLLDPSPGERLVVERTVDGAYRAKRYSDIERDRERGLTTQYWAKLLVPTRPARTRWVRVVGSPIVLPSGALDTFGIVEPVERVLEPKLEAALQDGPP
jgi:hypothetical protein